MTRQRYWQWFVLCLALLVSPLATQVLRSEEKAQLEKPEKLILGDLLGDFGKTGRKWKEAWVQNTGTGLGDAASLALKVATHPELDRTRLRAEIKYGEAAVKAAPRNLDIGRHDLLKVLLSRACERANKRLESEGLTLLDRATTVNSGGTGDFTRDVDVTVFGGDSLREQYLFEAVLQEAGELGLKCDPDPKYGVKAGLNFPQIEVAFHRGNNDLPDARFASDVHTFAVDYRRVVENQAKNPEAYFGYGFEVEVQGRRSLSFKPGQTLVQEFVCEPGKPVRYQGQIAASQREVRSFLKGAIGQRYRRAQNASHITNHFLQAFRHEQGTDHDLSKGALKYAGRTIEALCEYHGMKNWPDLVLEDRVVVLKSLFPAGYGEKANERATLEHMAESLDVAYLTFTGKKVPGQAGGKAVENPEMHAEMCMRFMQKAVSTTASAVAEEMLNPPSFSPRFLEEAAKQAGKSWDSMNAKERNEFAMLKDDNYKKCCSVAAMENLLCIVQQVRQLDLPDYNKKGGQPSKEAFALMLDSASEKTRPILQLAIDHAEAAVALDLAKDPTRRSLAEARLKEHRRQMEALTGLRSAGEAVVEKARTLAPEDFVKASKERKPYPLGDDIADMRRRFSAHLEEAFPPTDLSDFRAYLKEVGVKSYLGNKLAHEIASPATAMDLISLIEVYQNGGDREALAKTAGISLVNRGHWALGFLIQAAEVKTESDVVELGKNVVFDAFSRVVPGVGSFKLAFDLEKGLLNITVGYSLNQLNASTIDALYTGEAGRVNTGTAGKVGGSRRESGICILEDRYVSQVTDEKTKKVSVVVQKNALYQDTFKRWTGRDPYNTTVVTNDIKAGQLTRAHDELLRLLEDQARSQEPGWFGGEKRIKPSPEMIQAAMNSYYQVLLNFTRPEAEAVMAETATRSYMQGDKNVLMEGLVTRYTQDLLTGTIAAWQTRQIERMDARRGVESSANFADLNQFATTLAKDVFKPSSGKEKPKYSIDVRLPGGGLDAELNPASPVPVQFALLCDEAVPVDMQDVAFEVEPGRISPPEDGKKYVPGELFTQAFLVKAVCAGELLAKADYSLKMRVAEKQENQKLELLEYVDKDEKGTLRVRFTYYDRDVVKKTKAKLPVTPVTDGNKIMHGKYVEYDYKGAVKEELEFSYGHKNGVRKWYDSGYLNAETEFVMGKQRKHTCFYPDGTKKWDMEYDAQDKMVSHKVYWGEGEAVMEHITVTKVSPENTQSGLYQSFWKSGTVNIRTEYVDLPVGELANKENIERYRHGEWLSNWKSGQACEQGQTNKGTPVGPWKYHYKNGKPKQFVTFDQKGSPIENETWEYFENGNLHKHVHVREGVREGEQLENHESGSLLLKETYANGKLEGPYAKGTSGGVLLEEGRFKDEKREGAWVWRGEDGKLRTEAMYSGGDYNGPYVSRGDNEVVLQRGSYKNGKQDGKWEDFNQNGLPSLTRYYKEGVETGVWIEYDDKGKRQSWTEYANGRVVKRGDYKQGK